MTWIAPDVERLAHYPERRDVSEQEMLRDWLDWHRATLLRKCAGLDAAQLATRAVPPSGLSLLGLVRHMSDTELGWVRQAYRGEQVPDLYYRPDTPDADFAEADPASAEQDFERYRASAGPSMPRSAARGWTRPSPLAGRPCRCDGCGSTSWRSTHGTTGTPT